MVGSDQVSIHTTQTDSRLSLGSSTASDKNTQTMVLHHVSSSYEEMLHPPGFPRISAFPPRRGAMINVVSQDEDPPTRGETDQQRRERQQCNADRAQHRIDEDTCLAQQQADRDQQEADAVARRNRLQGRNLNDAFDMVGNRPVFKTPSANVAVAIESLKRLPDTLEIQNIREDLQAYL
jgi:hypothetical protein